MSNHNNLSSPKCPECMGVGWVLGRVAVLCPACLGAGEVQGKKCASCNGSGKASVETEILCDQCQGDGAQPNTQPIKGAAFGSI